MDLVKDSQRLLKDLEGIDSALQLDLIVERCTAFGRRCVEHGERVNSLVALFPGWVGFRQTGFDSDEEKEEVFGQAENYLAQRGARLAVLIFDTWVSSEGSKRPSADPNRQEALVVHAVAPDGRAVYSLVAIYERVGDEIKWHAPHAGPSGRQYMLRPWVATIDGITAPVIIPTKADCRNIRIFPPIEEQGNLRDEQ